MPARPPAKVLAIGFDSATPELLERGIAEGWLPNLAQLRSRGTYGRLRTTADWLVSSPWPSFAMGAPPAEHGCYHFVQWDPQAMALRRVEAETRVREPFWRELSRGRTRVIALDVPYSPAPVDADGVELSGWATNELIFPPFAQPPWVERLARQTYGRSPRAPGQALEFERFVPQPLDALLRTRDLLVRTMDPWARLTSEILRREPWDLAIAAFGTAHRAGHLFWSGSSVAGEGGPQVERRLESALRDVYEACDEAIGTVVSNVGDETSIVVFGFAAMGPNTSRTDLLPTMLARILSDSSGTKVKSDRVGLAKRVRGAVPAGVRHAVKARLPLSIQDRLGVFWRAGRVDWTRTRAFSLMADVNGYVRINLRGREAQGIVEPGSEYEELCESIANALRGFVDIDTGEPIVDSVERVDHLFPDAPARNALPDLIVRWAPTPCAAMRGAESPRFGAIHWPTPQKNPNGRSGNHTSEGFLLATGDGIPPSSTLSDGARALDVPPTILGLLGKEQPSYMTGRPLGESCTTLTGE